MGIPSYFSHLIRGQCHILKKYQRNVLNIDNFFMDCNSIIYDSVRELDYNKYQNNKSFERDLIQLIIQKIDEYITLISPSKKTMIAFDGVAPIAKLEQQKNRRYKTQLQKYVLNNHTREWNTCAITPGTEFMKNMGNQIFSHYQFNKNIIVSTSEEHGEGEHKIYKYIRDNTEYIGNDVNVVYGLDADLIMLSLNHLTFSNKLFLLRETPCFIKNIDETLDPNEHYILDIPELSKEIKREINNDNIHDYVFICFMMGNDFLPHFPALNIRTNGLSRVINQYRYLRNNKNFNIIDKNNKIIWKNFRKFVKNIADNELDFIKSEYKIRDKISNNIKLKKFVSMEHKFNSIPILDRRVELYINPFENGWEERYYKKLFDIEITEERKNEICINYLEGLEWTYKYYTFGCPNWEWTYKYKYPPLLSDLINYIPYFSSDFIENKKENPLQPLVQLSYVLPWNSLNLLPTKIQKQLEMTGWYRNNNDISWSFCKYFWESHVDFHDVEINKLKDIVNK